MIRILSAFIVFAVVFGGPFALSTQSDEAKVSPSGSRKARIHLGSPPLPDTLSIVSSVKNATKAQASKKDDASLEKEAKTSHSSSHTARNYFVPPPPPYMPSIVPSELGMTNAQAVAADDAVVDKSAKPYSNKILTRNQGDMAQGVQPDASASYHRSVEKKILKQIDSFDSEISSHEKEIGKLLNL